MPTKTSLSKSKIVQVSLSDLNPAEYNPRQITENQFNDLKDSIQKFGFVEPIVVNNNKQRKNVVIGGHQRLRVAEFLNMDSVPVVYIDLNEEKEKELNIRLNANGGSWDWDVIANEWNYSELRNWGLNVPNPTFDYPELLDDSADTISTENAGTDRSDFILSMDKENKNELLEVINRVKLDNELINTEDVLMLIVRSYQV